MANGERGELRGKERRLVGWKYLARVGLWRAGVAMHARTPISREFDSMGKGLSDRDPGGGIEGVLRCRSGQGQLDVEGGDACETGRE